MRRLPSASTCPAGQPQSKPILLLIAVYEPITDIYRIGADIAIFGFADMENVYQYPLSVSADTRAHIGYLADMLNCVYNGPEILKMCR